MPSVHMPQVPLPQTMFIPQTVPFACVSVSSMHVIAPSLQTNIPLWHGLAGTHAPPATQLLTGTSTAPESTNTVSPPPASKGFVLPPVLPARARAQAAARAGRRVHTRGAAADAGGAAVVALKRQPPQPAATARERRGAGNEEGDREAIFKQHRATS